jgi:signal transduction histidine kinase
VTSLSAGRAGWLSERHHQTRILLGRGLAATSVVLALYGMGALIVIGRSDYLVNDYMGPAALCALGFGLLTWFAIPHQSGNRAVWVTGLAALSAGAGITGWGTAMLTAGLAGLDVSFAQGWYDLNPAQVPAVSAWAWSIALAGVSIAFFLVITLALLYFPDGEVVSPGWRWVSRAAVLLIPTAALATAWEWRPGSTLAFGADSSTFTSIGRFVDVIIPALLLVSALSVASLVVGYRRSSGATRQQYKWIALGGAAFLIPMIGVIATQPTVPAGTETGWRILVFVVSTAALIISYGIAVTRYRLYDIDIVISRTVVFVLLAGFITLVYAVLVVGLGSVIGRGEGLVLPIVATAVVAVAFEPVRLRVQRWANRLVYGRRATPYEVLSDLTKRLAASEEGEGILGRMARLIHEGTGADRVTVWLGSPGGMEAAATWPLDVAVDTTLDLGADGVFPVHHDGEVVGALEVVKSRGNVMSPQERNLILDVVGSAGLVLGYQRLNDSLTGRAREVERSRSRLVGAQDEERRRMERELREGAQQLIVSLKTHIADASRLAEQQEARELGSLLESLEAESQLALDEISSLAKGIYPQVLVSDGLAAAVSALAASAPVDVQFVESGVGRHPLDVEAGVYFDITEAVTNAVKHARPPIMVRLSDDDGLLRFVVTDRGPGFDIETTTQGSGLENMRDRIEALGGRLRIDSGPGAMTTVTGEIPVASTAAGESTFHAAAVRRQ